MATGSVDIIDKAITLAGELVAESTSFKVSGLEPLSLHMKQLRSDPINPSSRIEPDTDSGERGLTSPNPMMILRMENRTS